MSEKLSVHAVILVCLKKNEKQATEAMGSLSVLLFSSTWYVSGSDLIFISLATVDIKSI